MGILTTNPAVIEWAERNGLDPTEILPELDVRRSLPGESGKFSVGYVRVAADGRHEACVLHTDEEPPPVYLLPKAPDWRARAEAAEAKVARVEAEVDAIRDDVLAGVRPMSIGHALDRIEGLL